MPQRAQNKTGRRHGRVCKEAGQKMLQTSNLLSLPYVNEHGDDRDNSHDNLLDNMGGDVSLVVIELTGETFPSTTDDFGAKYGAHTSPNSGPYCTP